MKPDTTHQNNSAQAECQHDLSWMQVNRNTSIRLSNCAVAGKEIIRNVKHSLPYAEIRYYLVPA